MALLARRRARSMAAAKVRRKIIGGVGGGDAHKDGRRRWRAK